MTKKELIKALDPFLDNQEIMVSDYAHENPIREVIIKYGIIIILLDVEPCLSKAHRHQEDLYPHLMYQ